MVPEPNCWKATRMVPGSVLRPPQPASAVSGSTVATPALSRRKVRRSGADRVTGSRATKTSSSTSGADVDNSPRSEEHTSELQSRGHLVCRLLLEKKKKKPAA